MNLLTGKHRDLEHFMVFGCTSYGLPLPAPSRVEVRAQQGVLLKSLGHSTYHVLIMTLSYENIDSHHITFDKNMFQGASRLENVMQDERHSDSNYVSGSAPMIIEF